MSLCMPWLQVLDESEKSGWGDEVKKYQVHGIPDFALIDGDSGIVIACDIGGEELDSTIAKALESKTQNK